MRVVKEEPLPNTFNISSSLLPLSKKFGYRQESQMSKLHVFQSTLTQSHLQQRLKQRVNRVFVSPGMNKFLRFIIKKGKLNKMNDLLGTGVQNVQSNFRLVLAHVWNFQRYHIPQNLETSNEG